MDVMVRVQIVSRCVHAPNSIDIWIISGTSANCVSAFMFPDQHSEQVACETDNVCAKLAISKNARYLTVDLGQPRGYLLWLTLRESDPILFSLNTGNARVDSESRSESESGCSWSICHYHIYHSRLSLMPLTWEQDSKFIVVVVIHPLDRITTSDSASGRPLATWSWQCAPASKIWLCGPNWSQHLVQWGDFNHFHFLLWGA